MGILYTGMYAKFRCVAWEFLSKQGVVSPWVVRPGCPAHCLVGYPRWFGLLGLKNINIVGSLESNGYTIYRNICKV